MSLHLDSDMDTVETSEMFMDLEKKINMGWKEQVGEADYSFMFGMLQMLDKMLEVRSMQEREG